MMWMTFDLDGVVMENPFHLGVFPHILHRIVSHCQETEQGRGKEPEKLREEAFQYLLAEHKQRFASEAAYEAYDWDAIVAELTDHYDYPETFDIGAIVKLYCQEPYIKCHDQADSVWHDLKEQGWKIGVVTNGYAKYQVPVLEALGLYPLIDTVVTPDQAYGIKPDLAIFHAIPGVQEKTWVHVGDTLVHDVYGGRKAGARTTWVHRRMPEEWKALTPWDRVYSAAGQELIRTVWEKEAIRYPGLSASWEECIPDWMIFDLAELLQWRKELYDNEKTS